MAYWDQWEKDRSKALRLKSYRYDLNHENGPRDNGSSDARDAGERMRRADERRVDEVRAGIRRLMNR